MSFDTVYHRPMVTKIKIDKNTARTLSRMLRALALVIQISPDDDISLLKTLATVSNQFDGKGKDHKLVRHFCDLVSKDIIAGAEFPISLAGNAHVLGELASQSFIRSMKGDNIVFALVTASSELWDSYVQSTPIAA